MFAITCPRCQTTISVRDSDAGQKVACPCGQRLLVPQPPPNKTVLAPLAPTVPTQQVPTTLHQPPVAQVVPVEQALSRHPRRLFIVLAVVGLLVGVAVGVVIAKSRPSKGSPVAQGKPTKAEPAKTMQDTKDKPDEPPEEPSTTAKVAPEDKPKSPFSFDINDTDAVLKWFREISEPVWKANDNEVAQERAYKAMDAEMAKLKGQKVKWSFVVRRVAKSGIFVQELLHRTAGRFDESVRLEVSDDSAEDGQGNHFAIKDEDFLATLKTGDTVTVSGTVSSVRDAFRGPRSRAFRFIIRLADVTATKSKD